MDEKLKRFRSEKYVGTAQLADQAARLVGQFAPRQERGSVSEVPDERTVRYYSAEGLISPPEGRQGQAAVYGYRHLLQLLAIKRLQAEHLPIRKIKDLVEGKSERELEQVLEPGRRVHKREKPANAATEYLEALLTTAPRPAAILSEPPGESSDRLAWARIEIEPGLELHIRDDYRLSDEGRQRRRLARRTLLEIERHAKRPRK